MSITFGDNLKHNNPNFPIADITDIKGGLRSIATFSDASLLSEYTTGTGGTPIPEKYKTGYSLMLERSTGTIYYLSGISPTNSSNWTRSGGNVAGTGTTNSITKWIGSTSLGDSNITDNGDTVTINGNLLVIGTTSTISSENLLVKDPIILLAGSQSGVPTYDAGLFINRGSSETQAFIWDESMDEFKFITTTSGATVSGDVSIGTYSSVRTGVLSVGTGTASNSRFSVSSSGGTVSLIVDEDGYVYNRGRGNISTNTAFGLMTLGTNTTGNRNTAFGASALSVNTTGGSNTAIGHQSLNQNISGSNNTAIGTDSLRYNINSNNTAVGVQSLLNNTIGSSNTAVGANSLQANTTTIASLIITDSGSSYTPSTTFSSVQLLYISGSTAMTYPTVTVYVGSTGSVSTVTLVTNGSGFKNASTIMGANLGTGVTFSVSIAQIISGDNNTALGYNSLVTNTSGYFNTGIGAQTLYSNITGVANTALGMQSLSSNTTGNQNTAVGYQAMAFNTIGSNNTALGYQSTFNNRIGTHNIAIGYQSLYTATQSSFNIAIGHLSSYFNTTGTFNTAIGNATLFFNTTGSSNTALGVNALFNNKTGLNNTALGQNSLYDNTIGSNNTALGYNAGYFMSGTTSGATNSINSVFLGYDTRPQGASQSNQIVIGYGATGNGSNSVTLGNNSIVKTYLKGKVVIADGTQGPGKVLISDASGESSWANISFGGGGSTSSFYIKGTSTYSYDTTSDIFRTGAILIGSGSVDTSDRFVVSSTVGTVSLVVDNNGSVYNKSRGISNTIFGYEALLNNQIGTENIAIGRRSLNSATSSSYNTAIGNDSLYTNTTGTQNTALGFQSLYSNTIGSFNVAFGIDSLFNNKTGDSNTALGWKSLYNTNSSYNTAIGWQALYSNTIGTGSVAIGYDAGTNFTNGTGATNSNNSIFIGPSTKPQLDGQSNQIVIGHGATGNGSNTVTLGNNSITNTYLKGDVQTNGTMTATGFFNSSDARLKDIVERDGDTIKFTWKDKRDDKVHIGYIAQEVQEKYPDQVNENSDGMLTVNYIEVLVAKIQQLENRIKQLEK